MSAGHFSCHICKLRFTTENALERHKIKHYVAYKCRMCDFNTPKLLVMSKHAKKIHDNDKIDGTQCQRCPVVVQRMHREKRAFECGLCGKSFKTKPRLESHLAGHGGPETRRLAYCDDCGKQFGDIHTYRQHLKTSPRHVDRRFRCTECDKGFTTIAACKLHHSFEHLQKSKHKCEVCNKLYLTSWKLKSHVQAKHDLHRSRDHACKICGKKFFTKNVLSYHVLTHSDQRTLLCEVCGDTFRLSAALFNHVKLVHKGAKQKQKKTKKNTDRS